MLQRISTDLDYTLKQPKSVQIRNQKWSKLIASYTVTSKKTQSDWFMRTAVKIGWMLPRGGGTFCCASTGTCLFVFWLFVFILIHRCSNDRFLADCFLFAFPVYKFCSFVYYFCWQVCMFTCLLACYSILHWFFTCFLFCFRVYTS